MDIPSFNIKLVTSRTIKLTLLSSKIYSHEGENGTILIVYHVLLRTGLQFPVNGLTASYGQTSTGNRKFSLSGIFPHKEENRIKSINI